MQNKNCKHSYNHSCKGCNSKKHTKYVTVQNNVKKPKVVRVAVKPAQNNKQEEKNKNAKKQKKERKQLPQREFTLKIALMSILLALAFSLAGSYIYNYYFGNSQPTISRGEVTLHVVEKTEEPILENYDPNSIPVITRETKDCVVAITTSTLTNSPMMGQYVKEGAGSGVIVSTDGYIVTNTHVISGANNITVRLTNDAEYKATVIGTDVTTDLSVIKIDVTGLKPAVIGNSENLVVGQTVIAIGNPLGRLGGTVTAGILSAKDREITINNQAMNLLQFDAAVNPGNSGGGLFNLDGELIGIVNAKTSGMEVEGLGFAIPSSDAKLIITELIETGKVSGRPQLGITVAEIKSMTDKNQYIEQELYNFIDSTGLYIVSATNPSLFVGDKLIALDGQSINTFDDIQNIINTKKVGDQVQVTVSRNKQMVTITIELTEKN